MCVCVCERETESRELKVCIGARAQNEGGVTVKNKFGDVAGLLS